MEVYQHNHNCYMSCLFDFPWFIHTQQYVARIGYHKIPRYAVPFIRLSFWSKCSCRHISIFTRFVKTPWVLTSILY